MAGHALCVFHVPIKGLVAVFSMAGRPCKNLREGSGRRNQSPPAELHSETDSDRHGRTQNCEAAGLASKRGGLGRCLHCRVEPILKESLTLLSSDMNPLVPSLWTEVRLYPSISWASLLVWLLDAGNGGGLESSCFWESNVTSCRKVFKRYMRLHVGAHSVWQLVPFSCSARSQVKLPEVNSSSASTPLSLLLCVDKDRLRPSRRLSYLLSCLEFRPLHTVAVLPGIKIKHAKLPEVKHSVCTHTDSCACGVAWQQGILLQIQLSSLFFIFM